MTPVTKNRYLYIVLAQSRPIIIFYGPTHDRDHKELGELHILATHVFRQVCFHLYYLRCLWLYIHLYV